MSEETLRRFLERLNTDAAFRESARQNPATALDEFELSAAEQAALATNDEDALRRLAGSDVSGFLAPGGAGAGAGTGIDVSIFWFCGPTEYCFTPNSKRHCGTGRCGETLDCGDELSAR